MSGGMVGHGMVMDGASVTALQCSGHLSLKHCVVSPELARHEGQEPVRAHAPRWPHVCQLCIITGDLAFSQCKGAIKPGAKR